MGEVSYKGHRYPAEIIAHCVWLYHRFPLSFREVEELLLVRGMIVSYETIAMRDPGAHHRGGPCRCAWAGRHLDSRRNLAALVGGSAGNHAGGGSQDQTIPNLDKRGRSDPVSDERAPIAHFLHS